MKIGIVLASLLAALCMRADEAWNYLEHRVPAVRIPDGCWFDTGVRPTEAPKVSMSFKRVNAVTTDVFGTKTAQDGCLILSIQSNAYYYRYGVSASSKKAGTNSAGFDVALEADTKLVVGGDSLLTVAQTNAFAACEETVCFPGQRNAKSLIVSSFTMETNGVVACEMVPCEKEGEVGFYDTVGERFVSMSGSGTAVACAYNLPTDVAKAMPLYPVYTVTVTGDTPVELADAEIEVVSAPGATPTTTTVAAWLPLNGGERRGTFVKRGAGVLHSCTNMVNFLGEIWIEAGAFVVRAPCECGPQTKFAGAIRVASDASFGMNVGISLGGQNMLIRNTIFVQGEGRQGKGAVYNDSDDAKCGGNNMCACFHGKIVLDDDATFGGTGGKWGDAAALEGYFLNGHTLTVTSKGQYRTNGGKLYDGHVVIAKGSGQNPQSGMYFGGGTSNSVTFCENSTWGGYHANTFSFYTPWTLNLRSMKIAMSGAIATANSYWDKLNYDNWNGPAVVEGLVTVANTGFENTYAAYPFSLNGLVSGPGGFNVTRGWLHFSNATNAFEGPLSIDQSDRRYIAGVGFFKRGAYPAENDCTFTNKNGAIYVVESRTALPTIDYTVTSGWTNATVFGDGTVVAKGLVKRGAGTLDLRASVAVRGKTELLEGAIKVAPPKAEVGTLYSSVPGLYESVADFGTDDLPSGFVSSWYTNGANTPTNGVTSYPVFAERSGTGGGWSTHMGVRYQGYIWNRGAEPITMSFASCFATAGELWLDGERFVGSWYKTSSGGTGNCVWYYLRTNTVVLTSGPHKFDFRAYNNGYGTGGARDAYAVFDDATGKERETFTSLGVPRWPYDFGLVFKSGGPSLLSADYEIPRNGLVFGSDGGDGVLFTRDARTAAECGDEIEQYRQSIIRGGELYSTFSNLTACAGTEIDMQGGRYPLYVTDFAGSTVVKNGDVCLEGTWTVSDTDVLPTSGAFLTAPQGKVIFAPGAAIRVTGNRAVRNLLRRNAKLVDAGYEGMPTILVDPEDPMSGNWKLRADADGLYLGYESGMVLIVK